jgi:carbonic anhydrase
MQKLVSGVDRFQKQVFDEATFRPLVQGQHPAALFITCSDSRIDPNLITQTAPGDLFVVRNAGNIVPAYGGHGGEEATIEYAMAVLKVRDVVVCGHSHCGAMGGLLNADSLESLPSVRSWLAHADSTRQIVSEKYKDLKDPEARLTAAVEENVLVQLENLRTHPSVSAALARGEVDLHGWVYHFESGQVRQYDPRLEEFVPLTEAQARQELAS